MNTTMKTPESTPRDLGAATLALVGNPNVGKTTLFNRLTNLSAKTSNFPGTTVERRQGTLSLPNGERLTVLDLPGLYSLQAPAPEEKLARDVLSGQLPPDLDAILIVVDATNLSRSLFMVGEALQLKRPTIVAVNMVELARDQKIQIDFEQLSQKLGCPVIPVSARTGEGIGALLNQIQTTLNPVEPLPVLAAAPCESCTSCPYAHGHQWASELAGSVCDSRGQLSHRWTDRIDRWATHAAWGPLLFIAVMFCVFSLVFWLAAYPMDWIDGLLGGLAETVGGWLPAGDISSLITDGIIGGAGSVVVFLPQICILFFVLTLLEDSGYLARAVVVVDRWMQRVGLPGHAFVPMLTAHACAIPAIMSTRVIENRRDRLAAIMVIPLMTCSARLPVYTILAALLFPGQATYAACVFVAAYALGILTAFAVAWVLKRTILPGQASHLILDLPVYRRPSLRNAILQAYRRGMVFLRDAGTVILFISIAIWALSTYPKLSEEQFQTHITNEGIQLQQLDETEQDHVRARVAQEHALIGRAGRLVEPIFRPLGFEWQTSVGVLTSFAAREVVVSTLSVLYGLGDGADDTASLQERLAAATRPDGTPAFDTPTCVSLLVFFVVAMQCLPTQAVTKRETGSWGWAIFQLVYMTLLAYGMAFVAYRICGALLTGA